jgi:histidinol-phosphate aminotransferase
MLIKVGDGAAVTKSLTELGVIVRPMTPYGLQEWIRVSFGRPEENEKFVEALERVLQGS